jgi:formylglycine-generating enzyme
MTTELRDFIVESFDRQELLTLCVDYFQDFYNDYAGVSVTNTALARELVMYCERRDELSRLKAALMTERPQPYAARFGELAVTTIVARRRDLRRIFLSYAYEDSLLAHRLANDLRAHKFDIWIAPTSIQPGERWVRAIDRGLGESGTCLTLLSPSAIESAWVKSETEFALQAQQRGDGRIVPIMARTCQVGDLSNLLTTIQYVDFRTDYDAALRSLVQALQTPGQQPVISANDIGQTVPQLPPKPHAVKRSQVWPMLTRRKLLLGGGGLALTGMVGAAVIVSSAVRSPLGVAARNDDPLQVRLTPDLLLPLVRVPAGEFIMGSDKAKDDLARADEFPQRIVFLSEYLIGRYEVTNAQYAVYAAARKILFRIPEDKGDHPVVTITWDNAADFCVWLSELTGRRFFLPTEAQWEKAARGTDGRIYPWGNEFDAVKANTKEDGGDVSTPYGAYSPAGDSPYGAADMSGNVWEWCADWYDEKAYAAVPTKSIKDPTGPEVGTYRVIRGGSWFLPRLNNRVTCRNRDAPNDQNNFRLGFRVVGLA